MQLTPNRAQADTNRTTGQAWEFSTQCLRPFWSRQLGKTEFVAYQASARGGMMRVRVAGERVYLGGRAVTVLRGEWID